MFALLLTASIVIAQAVGASASPSPSPSVTPSTSPAPSGKRTLTIPVPHGWRRVETGQYNAWLSPDGMTQFRVSAMPVPPEWKGPGAADSIAAEFAKMLKSIRPSAAPPTVIKVQACNGTQDAYRINDPLGLKTGGFMEIIPGSDTSGLINYEAMGPADPAILDTVSKICWP